MGGSPSTSSPPRVPAIDGSRAQVSLTTSGRDKPQGTLIAAIAIGIVIVGALALLFSGLIPGFHLSIPSREGGGSGGAGPSYSVMFTQSGLPPGTAWSVNLTSTTGIEYAASTTNTIDFEEPNGTYSFEVRAVPGYHATPKAGAVLVNGAAVNQSITFNSSTADPLGTELGGGFPVKANLATSPLPGGPELAEKRAQLRR